MRFVPTAISRKVAVQAIRARKNSPTILFGAGVASMVGSTVLACRATLKLEEVLDKAHSDIHQAESMVESHPDEYSEKDRKQDVAIIYTRNVVSVTKLYAPSIILGGVGIVCLTKSHQILKDRNAALAAAYVAVDKAFTSYRARVAERYGEDIDRELRYGAEEVDIVDEDTGKVLSTVRVGGDELSGYARWFDEENGNWNRPPFDENNWLFLRTQQNWANDMLKARGHLFLNEVYSMLGLSHTSAGSIVGWIYKRDNDRGDNYVDFGCWDHDKRPADFFNGRDHSILLDFNVDGVVWDLIDESTARNS